MNQLINSNNLTMTSVDLHQVINQYRFIRTITNRGNKMKFAKYTYTKKNGITKDGHTMFEQDIVSELNRKSYLEQQLQQYESIVKKVDPDNLPDHEVWVWCEAGLSFGEIFMSRVFKQLIVDSKYGNYRNPTHYIEQDDLIKLFK